MCLGNERHEFLTFDGRSFDFRGNCSYVAARHVAAPESDFEVRFANEECEGRPGAFCTVEVDLHAGGEVVKLARSRQGEAVVYLGAEAQPKLSVHTARFATSVTPSGALAAEVVGAGVEVVFNVAAGSFVVRLPSAVYGGKVEGMCGGCGGDEDDGRTPAELGATFATSACEPPTPPPTLAQTACLNRNLYACERIRDPVFAPVSGEKLFGVLHVICQTDFHVPFSASRWCPPTRT